MRKTPVYMLLMALIIFSPGFCSNAQDSNLNNESWTVVNQPENVKFQPEQWQGPADLSYRYKIGVEAMKVFVMVEVNDDQVLLKDEPTITSDHVEFWLADADLAIKNQQSLIKLVKYQNSLKSDPEGSDFQKQQIASANRYIELYKRQRYYSQFIFNRGNVFNTSTRFFSPNISYKYNATANGYTFTAEIPLNGAIDLSGNQLKELKFLIDVVDIDQPDAVKQKSLLSSSNRRLFEKPGTFNNLALPLIKIFEMDQSDQIAQKLNPTGYFMFDGQRYRYQTETAWWRELGQEVIIPGYYEPNDLINQSHSSSYAAYLFQATLAIVYQGQYYFFDLSKDLEAEGYYNCQLLFQASKSSHHFLLINGEGSTSWPTSGLGSCGAGHEGNLIWLELDSRFVKLASKSFLYSSCVKSVEYDKKITQNKAIISTDNGRPVAVYDNDFPEKGLVVTK